MGSKCLTGRAAAAQVVGGEGGRIRESERGVRIGEGTANMSLHDALARTLGVKCVCGKPVQDCPISTKLRKASSEAPGSPDVGDGIECDGIRSEGKSDIEALLDLDWSTLPLAPPSGLNFGIPTHAYTRSHESSRPGVIDGPLRAVRWNLGERCGLTMPVFQVDRLELLSETRSNRYLTTTSTLTSLTLSLGKIRSTETAKPPMSSPVSSPVSSTTTSPTDLLTASDVNSNQRVKLLIFGPLRVSDFIPGTKVSLGGLDGAVVLYCFELESFLFTTAEANLIRKIGGSVGSMAAKFHEKQALAKIAKTAKSMDTNSDNYRFVPFGVRSDKTFAQRVGQVLLAKEVLKSGTFDAVEIKREKRELPSPSNAEAGGDLSAARGGAGGGGGAGREGGRAVAVAEALAAKVAARDEGHGTRGGSGRGRGDGEGRRRDRRGGDDLPPAHVQDYNSYRMSASSGGGAKQAASQGVGVGVSVSQVGVGEGRDGLDPTTMFYLSQAAAQRSPESDFSAAGSQGRPRGRGGSSRGPGRGRGRGRGR